MIKTCSSSHIKPLLSVILILCSSLTALELYAQDDPPDSLKIAEISYLQLAVNGYNRQPKLSSFEEFQQKASYGKRLAAAGKAITSDETFESRAAYIGMMVNFLFTSKLLNQKTAYDREFFTTAFEAGRSNVALYRVSTDDTTSFSYDFRSNIFRITLGYQRILTKKDRKFKIYSGLELVNEFNISGIILERSIGSSFTDNSGEDFGNERKLHTRKSYNLYLNLPTGVSFRLSQQKKSYLFFNMNIALGTQNVDPFRVNGLYTGGRFGIALGI